MTDLNAAATAVPLVARAKAIILQPKAEWPVIAAEPVKAEGSGRGVMVLCRGGVPSVARG